MSTVSGYRLVKRKWLKSAFDGEGARLYGGRWNSKGNACVYLAGAESLAMLEVMVHLNDYRLLEDYALLEVTFQEDDLMRLPADGRPDDWMVEPAPSSTAEIGDGWLESQSSLVLAVPSVVVPRETNYLVNPNHAGFKAMVDGATEIAFVPDKRL
ncbi:RES family NAD+ phosphorylase [Chromohalobacter sarecensis]|uniref:RES family NAD+ phosphorylase n=1 Tax=Chromohalobacter sarecensis TaxID=245294 RepID=A0ABV9D3U3_9GAMM|nr:RES family NAD+ phosphorylase [Chromohalobacter sarecensis]MCK0714423.1 RES family NAD+ phosphorylase [Chromohalobacter sarecensis]